MLVSGKGLHNYFFRSMVMIPFLGVVYDNAPAGSNMKCVDQRSDCFIT